MVGRTLGHYRLLEQVGQGGMAAVYRARDLSLDRECAVKILHRHLQGDKESRLRFQREAQAVARLRHENILEVYAYSTADEGAGEDSFLVVEFIHGVTLRAHLLAHRPRFAEVGAMVGCEVARALAVAHREGIVHRDVKPENILIRQDGTLVLCDFGIARILDKDTMTVTGQLLGSPAYMAPEHIKGQHVDSRSDLFSLGILMYELIASELPFRGKNAHDTLTRIAAGTYTSLEEKAPLCSPELAHAVERLLDNNPDGRYQEAALLHDDLAALLRESSILDPRAELAAYFRDPLAWERAFVPRLKAKLVEAGRQLLRSRRTALALAVWGRAHQLDPDDREVLALLASLTRRRRLRRLIFRSAMAAVGIGAVAATTFLLYPRRAPGPRSAPPSAAPKTSVLPVLPPAPAAHAPSSPREPVAVPPAAAPSSEMAPKTLPGASERSPASRIARPAAAPAVPLRSVRLEPWPKAVRVTHNGRLLGAYGTDVRTVQLAPGRNEFLFENPACYSERVVLPPGLTPEEVRVRLRWKPALLLVRVHSGAVGTDSSFADRDSLSADVLVEGRLVGRSGQVLALPIDSDDSSRAVDVQVSAPGRRTVSRSLTVRANQLSQIELSLPPT